MGAQRGSGNEDISVLYCRPLDYFQLERCDMAFTGDLEHLPIVDVIQLMNSTRKSGVLSVRGRKGESQLVFKDGYIVSASHLNNSVRIGQVLTDMGLVSAGQLEEGLRKQQLDGDNRRPLAITLIEMAVLSEDNAYKGLQHLIEMTVVEILTWKSGRFTLEHLKDVVACDFKYYPQKMNHEINVNTQSMLMDALRIFDERKRDGLIQEELDEPADAELIVDELISVDDLGLEEMDHLNARLPEAFSGVELFDPALFQRGKIAELAPDLTEDDREKLVLMLAKYTKKRKSGLAANVDGPGVIVFSHDNLLLHGLDTILTDAGVLPVAVLSEEEMEKALASPAGRKISWLIADTQIKGSQYAKTRELKILQLAPSNDSRFTLNAYGEGATTVMPKPVKGQAAGFIEELIMLLELLPEYLSVNGRFETAVLL